MPWISTMPYTLLENMRINEADIEQRKHLLQFASNDATHLLTHSDWLLSLTSSLMSRHHKQLYSLSEMQVQGIDRTELLFFIYQYLKSLFSGEYGCNYIESRLHIGKRYQELGIPISSFLSSLGPLHLSIIETIQEKKNSENIDDEERQQLIQAIQKLFYLDIQLISESYYVAEQTIIEHKQKKLALIDPLTQIMNKRAFAAELDRTIAITKRCNSTVTLLYININNFKDINAIYGYEQGDNILTLFTDICVEQLRKSDSIARIHDDHFCIIMPNTPIENARLVCERMVELFDESCDIPISLSVGGSSYTSGEDATLEDLTGLANEQMFNAQRRSQLTDNHEFCFEFNKNPDNILFLAKNS